jgi:glutathione S-transferase
MIVLHHLSFSRSHRVIWLMEELGLPYRLVSYARDQNFRAPPELAAVHPLGKAPVIEDNGIVLAESAVILTYINERYGSGRLAPARDSDLYFLHEEWLHYVESTAALPIMMMRIGDLSGGLAEGTRKFIQPTLEKTLRHIANRVEAGPYLMGDHFTLADIQMAYILEIAASSGSLADRPVLAAYLSRLRARPAFEKANEIGGPMLPPPAVQ